MTFDVIFEKLTNKKFSKYVLALDVGGTSTQIGILGYEKEIPVLVYKSEVWTDKIPKISKLCDFSIDFANKNLGIKIHSLGVAVAGAINPLTQKVKTTNNKKTTSLEELKRTAKKYGIKKVSLMNDFEALGWSINILTKKDFKFISSGKKVINKPVLVIGAGTSVGINILTYNNENKLYIPINSEGANSDFVFVGKKEDELKKFMENKYERVLYENVVSGRGLENIYEFISRKKKDVFYIEKNRKKEIACKNTFKLFSKYYGRLTKNVALLTLPYSGIYICGGIAVRNPDIIGKNFLEEYHTKHEKQQFIKDIPIKLILSKDLSLKGAAYALLKN